MQHYYFLDHMPRIISFLLPSRCVLYMSEFTSAHLRYKKFHLSLFVWYILFVNSAAGEVFRTLILT